MCFLLIVPDPSSLGAKMCCTTSLDYRPAMEIASPFATIPCSTRSIEPATTSAPGLDGAESLTPQRIQVFRKVWTRDYTLSFKDNV